MSNNNQKEAKEITMTELAQEMRKGFQEMREKFSGVENRVSGIEKRLGGLESDMRQGFELMDAKIDAVDQKIEHKIEFLQEGLFTPDEKKNLYSHPSGIRYPYGKRSPAKSVSQAGND